MFIQEKLSTTKLDFNICKIDKDYFKICVPNFLYFACLQSIFFERGRFNLDFLLNDPGEIHICGHSRGGLVGI
jgi:hypothetical protein